MAAGLTPRPLASRVLEPLGFLATSPMITRRIEVASARVHHVDVSVHTYHGALRYRMADVKQLTQNVNRSLIVHSVALASPASTLLCIWIGQSAAIQARIRQVQQAPRRISNF